MARSRSRRHRFGGLPAGDRLGVVEVVEAIGWARSIGNRSRCAPVARSAVCGGDQDGFTPSAISPATMRDKAPSRRR